MAKFDAKYYERMRADVQQQKEMDAAKMLAMKKAARMNPAAPPERKMKPLTERIVFGARSRRDQSNRGGV